MVQGHQPGIGQACDCPFVWLAYVQQEWGVASREARRQLRWRDLVALSMCCIIGAIPGYTTERLVVDQSGDLASATCDALGIPLQIDRSESHSKGVDEQ